jgi:uncharacterized RDD family membrane protein YckC
MAEPYNPYAPPAAPPLSPGDPTSTLLAKRGQRFMGAFVDGLFGIALGYLPAVGLHAAGFDPFPAALTLAGASWQPSDLLALFVGLIPTGFQWWLISGSGQTVGKMTAHTRIMTLDGQVAGFRNGVLLRWVPFLAASVLSTVTATFAPQAAGSVRAIVGAFLFVDVLLIFGPSRRCLHDYIAGTRVVSTDESGH